MIQNNFKCMTPLRGLAIRATLLDNCDRPVDVNAIPNTQISTAAFTSLSLSPDTEDGESIRRKRADGSYCIKDDNDQPRLLGMEITLMLCDVPMAINELLVCHTLLANDEGTIAGFVAQGINYDNTDDGCHRRVMLEVWTENGNKSFCDEDGNQYRYIRWFIPTAFNWKLNSDIAFVNDDAVEWELMGYAEGNANFDSPVGLDNDPDLTQEWIEAIRSGGPVAAVCTNVLPPVSDCGYVNSPEALAASA